MQYKYLFLFFFSILCLKNHTLKGQGTQDNNINPKDSVLLKKVLVTATKFLQDIKTIGKTIYVIDRETIESSKGKSLGELLNDLPNTYVSGSYVPKGHLLNVYINGGRAKDTLILIDGMPFNDPSSINASFDLRMIDTANIESIEVIKDGLSTLYGTNASSAVINIKLKKNTKKVNASVGLDYGTYNTISNNYSVGVKGKKIRFYNTYNFRSTDGVSAIKGDNFKNDGMRKNNWHSSLAYRLNDKLNIKAYAMFNTFNGKYDQGFGFKDADFHFASDNVRLGINPNFRHKNGNMNVNLLYQTTYRDFQSSFPTTSNGKSLQLDAYYSYILFKDINLLAGINYQNSSYKNIKSKLSYDDTEMRLIDPYVSISYKLSAGFSIVAGARNSIHNAYGSQIVYNINPSYMINTDDLSINIFGSYSTAFITPTSYQLFSQYGNKDLKPEKSKTYSFGIKYDLLKAISIMASYYNRMEENNIGSSSDFKYENIDEDRKSESYELFINAFLTKKLSFTANYSFLDIPSDEKLEKLFIRIPAYKYGGALSYKPIERSLLELKYTHIGDRFESNTVNVPGFHLFDFTAQKSFFETHSLNVYFSVNNIADSEYVDTHGYNTLGRNFNIGLKFSY